MVGQNDTEQARIARLTDKQRECLHLVVMRKSSKEIARELGIAKPTVDQRIANAREILGARSRNEAAIIFARGNDKYDRIIYDSVRVPNTALFIDKQIQEAQQNTGLILKEPAIPFSGVFEDQSNARLGFRWSLSSDVNTINRLLIIVGMTVGILSIILIGLAVAQSLSGLLTAF
jgi:DNA-binding CsgD family transcriptional regulator